jgi:cystathionine gamma-synthase
LGRPPRQGGEAVNPPVVLSATYQQGGTRTYGRDDNPTWEALEEVLGALEGGRAVVFASGLAAISAVIETLPVPGQVVVPAGAYSGTRRFLADAAGRGRLQFRAVDITDTTAVLRACESFGPGALLWLETPTNPLMDIADLDELVPGAQALGLEVAVDNTFATPLLQRPLEFGADAVVHSATKFLSGHSDAVLGAVVTRRDDLAEHLARRRSLHGAVAGPWEAWLVLRGVRTLDVRLERAQANAAELARRLQSHPAVLSVLYPGLPSHPGHELAARQMRGFGAMLSFEVSGGAEAAEAVAEAVEVLTPATSLGGVETLIERRSRWEGEELLPPGLLRVSVGIEDVEDLWSDLDRALAVAVSPPG